MTVPRLQEAAGLSAQGARNVIRDAVARGWLEELAVRGMGGRVHWVAAELLDVLEAPWTYAE